MLCQNYEALKAHVGHQVLVVVYEANHEYEGDPASASVECWTCGEVLLSCDQEQKHTPEMLSVRQKFVEGLETLRDSVLALAGFHGLTIREAFSFLTEDLSTVNKNEYEMELEMSGLLNLKL